MEDSNAGKSAEEVLDVERSKVTEADVEKVVARADDIERKFEEKGPLGRLVKDGKLMLAMVKDYRSREYREVPWWTIAAIVGALLYIINPLDLVPDFIPFYGQLDDAAVITACIWLIEKDLRKYEKWKLGLNEAD